MAEEADGGRPGHLLLDVCPEDLGPPQQHLHQQPRHPLPTGQWCRTLPGDSHWLPGYTQYIRALCILLTVSPYCVSFSFFSDFTPSSLTQSLMTEVVQNSNVVEVTNQPGFLENLETLQQRLSVCEKALAEYLETKRLTFPRFYFVSASDLLEIVSKGTQPKQVTDYNLIMFSKRERIQR